jgi:hypothetical protein
MRSSTSVSIGEIVADVDAMSCVSGESGVWCVEAHESLGVVGLEFSYAGFGTLLRECSSVRATYGVRTPKLR